MGFLKRRAIRKIVKESKLSPMQRILFAKKLGEDKALFELNKEILKRRRKRGRR